MGCSRPPKTNSYCPTFTHPRTVTLSAVGYYGAAGGNYTQTGVKTVCRSFAGSKMNAPLRTGRLTQVWRRSASVVACAGPRCARRMKEAGRVGRAPIFAERSRKHPEVDQCNVLHKTSAAVCVCLCDLYTRLL